MFEQLLWTMGTTVALEAVTGKKQGRARQESLLLDRSGCIQAKDVLGPKSCSASHCLCSVPAGIFKVRWEGWQVTFCTASVTLEER